jgi:hypothetical protein
MKNPDAPPDTLTPVPESPQIDVVKINIDNEEDWVEPPKVSFETKATFWVANCLLGIFGGVYLLSFLMAFCMFQIDNMEQFNGMLELVKFLLGTIIPLVTLAVGYYLGDRNNSND